MRNESNEEPTPLFMHVADAARVLDVSRSFAYEMANLWLASGGAEGLPTIKVGGRPLVIRSAIERWASGGYEA